MAARAIGSGTIAFGLVAIPVKLFSTVDSTKAIRFNYLTEDGDRVKQQYVRATNGEVVERADLQQGYEFAKGQFVTFTKEEMQAMHVESTNAIDIAEFIPLAEVERIYIEKVYYLGPDKGAGRSYHLLKEALASTERAALASYAARGKCHLVLIRPFGAEGQDGLVMEQLKHQDELRSFADVPLDQQTLEAGELELAVQIIEQRVNTQFVPENYEDIVRSRMQELIQQKIDGQEIQVPATEQAEAKIVDLMAALQASVESSGSATGRKASKAGKTSKTAKKATNRKTAARAPRKPAATQAKSTPKRKSS
ncbi:MAG: Ku protein [Pseudomonadota bacterium]